MSLPNNFGVSRALILEHEAGVSRISSRLQYLHSQGKPYRVYHGSTNSTKPSYRSADRIVDTSNLTRILAVCQPVAASKDESSIIVEPNVSMLSLVDATLPLGLLPPVIMEFPGITCGGGFAGTSGESSSFREGVFDRSVTWIEMVLPNGEVVTATPNADDPHRDLYEGAASSFGTLGVVTALRIRLRPAKEFVYSRYVPVSSILQANDVMLKHQHDSNTHFIDGIMYGPDRGVVILGSFCSQPDLPEGVRGQRCSRPLDEWYYLHVEACVYPRSWTSFLSSKPTHATAVEVTEAVPTRDYLFRYDRGAFWIGKYTFGYLFVPFNRITRTLLDVFMHTATLYHAVHMSGLANTNIVQDIAVPLDKAPQLMDWLDQNFRYYPLWLCPVVDIGIPPLFHRETMSQRAEGAAPSLVLNFGTWGLGPKDRKQYLKLNRAIESEVQRLGGQKVLYAQVYYTEEEFWSVYGREQYDALRRKYHADWLPSVFDKMKVDLSVLDESDDARKMRERQMSLGEWLKNRFWDTWPFAGLYGCAHCMIKKEYVIAQDPFWKRWVNSLWNQRRVKQE